MVTSRSKNSHTNTSKTNSWHCGCFILLLFTACFFYHCSGFTVEVILRSFESAADPPDETKSIIQVFFFFFFSSWRALGQVCLGIEPQAYWLRSQKQLEHFPTWSKSHLVFNKHVRICHLSSYTYLPGRRWVFGGIFKSDSITQYIFHSHFSHWCPDGEKKKLVDYV